MEKKKTRYRFGADSGTFTDILVDDNSGHLVALKPSNRKMPEQSIVDGLVQLHESTMWNL